VYILRKESGFRSQEPRFGVRWVRFFHSDSRLLPSSYIQELDV